MNPTAGMRGYLASMSEWFANPSKEAILRDFFYTANGRTLAGNAAEAGAPTEPEEEGCGADL